MYTKNAKTSVLATTGRNLLLIFILFLPCVDASAFGQLMVTPTRIVFSGHKHAATVSLINNGSKTERYRISFVRRKMTEDGGLVPVKKNVPGMYSDPMILYSPHVVTLPAGQTQTIRLMLRKPHNLKDGEYRSHMLFQEVPDTSSTNIATLTGKTKSGIQIRLIPVIGVTIPVIVRQGKLNVKVTLSDFNIELKNQVRQQADLKMTINRTGNESAYGDIRAAFTPNGSKQSTVIGQANGISIYTPNKSRTFTLQLQVPPNIKLANGEIHVTYTMHGKDAKTGLLAEASLTLP